MVVDLSISWPLCIPVEQRAKRASARALPGSDLTNNLVDPPKTQRLDFAIIVPFFLNLRDDWGNFALPMNAQLAPTVTCCRQSNKLSKSEMPCSRCENNHKH